KCDQYRQENFVALDERVRLNMPGLKIRGDVWIGEGVEIDDVEGVEGPGFIGNYARISPEASVGPYTGLGCGASLAAGVLLPLHGPRLGDDPPRARPHLAHGARRVVLHRPGRGRRRGDSR